MQPGDLAGLIKTRRSIRRWQAREVPRELLLQAVELATWAPNGGNRQNWHFYIILNRDTIQAIADAVQASADRLAAWPEANQFGSEVSRWRQNASFFRTAPAAIAAFLRKRRRELFVSCDICMPLTNTVIAKTCSIRSLSHIGYFIHPTI